MRRLTQEHKKIKDGKASVKEKEMSPSTVHGHIGVGWQCNEQYSHILILILMTDQRLGSGSSRNPKAASTMETFLHLDVARQHRAKSRHALCENDWNAKAMNRLLR